jgi:MarR family transcriptional regulator, lower aerobic nicotinate degradation pathway regulator
MTKERPDRPVEDAERAMNALRRLVRALRVSTAAVKRTSGISGAQLFVLRELAERPGQSLRDLIARTLTSQSTVSEVVAGLVEARLVNRQAAPQDGRRAVLRPTPAGRALLRAAPPTVQADLVDGLRRISPGSLSALADGLEQWLAAAGLAAVPPTMFFETKRQSRGARASE